MQTFQSPDEVTADAHRYAGACDALLGQIGAYRVSFGPRGRSAADSLQDAWSDLCGGLVDTLETLHELYDVEFDRISAASAIGDARSARSELDRILTTLREEVTAADA